MRFITPYISRDLNRKMVFVAGPRQCGITTLAKSLLSKSDLYLNWDDDVQRRMILNRQWNDKNELLVFDELHKFKRWKNWVKGIYDTQKEKHQILVTGSARLDVYRTGGDSLLGRYHHWRLFPFTLSETPHQLTFKQALNKMMLLGNFPEPLLYMNEREARRWRLERFQRVIRDDVRSLEDIKNIPTLEMFADMLRHRVGSLIVLSNMAQDLQVSPKTLKFWIEVLEKMYMIFTVKPYSKGVHRSIQKPFKVYFYDSGDVIGDEGARFENLVAVSLLQWLHFLGDYEGYRYSLNFLRDKEKREVDFVLVKEDNPLSLIECKWSDTSSPENLKYFSKKLNIANCVHLVGQMSEKKKKSAVQALPVETFFLNRMKQKL